MLLIPAQNRQEMIEASLVYIVKPSQTSAPLLTTARDAVGPGPTSFGDGKGGEPRGSGTSPHPPRLSRQARTWVKRDYSLPGAVTLALSRAGGWKESRPHFSPLGHKTPTKTAGPAQALL